MSLMLALSGDWERGLRALFLAFFFDVIDGWLARRHGSSPMGQLLDRAFDRVSQVIAPVALYATRNGVSDLYMLYGAGLIVISLWRLVSRQVASLAYFAGLPMMVHAAVLISATILGVRLPQPLLIAMLVATVLPIPYVRRAGRKGSPSPGAHVRALLALVLAALPFESWPVKVLAKVMLVAAVVYTCAGWIPLYRKWVKGELERPRPVS